MCYYKTTYRECEQGRSLRPKGFEFEIKAYADNLPSLHLIQKLSGIEVGREENEFISIFSKGGEITGEKLLEEDSGLDKEVVKSLLDRYIKVKS